MRVLVTGGCGYIGSHTVVQLLEADHHVVIVDNLSNASRSVLPRVEQITGVAPRLHEFDVRDAARLDALFGVEPIDAVLHFAGLKAVGESVAKPLEYYENNLDSSMALVRAMIAHGVQKLVFSSSATVYGQDAAVPMTEDAPTSATNPYGWTKVMIEQIFGDVAAATPGFQLALLRYFNPAGAHPSGLMGEDPQDIPNNLVPLLCRVAIGRSERLNVFGADYDTPDGTCQRDYIHVLDLAAGHLAALEALGDEGPAVRTWNLGTGRATSVLELLHVFEEAIGRELPHAIAGRRAGDVAVSYADPARARAELGWSADRTVAEMCADAWRWQQANPEGYPE
ncbi:MAG TPA: UDP-glucose 4-epimerase GalE [Mycobacterium sp.]|jgi:UDP-glucose 4-epimerase